MPRDECSSITSAGPGLNLLHNSSCHGMRGTIDERRFSIIKNDNDIFEFRFSRNTISLDFDDLLKFVSTVTSKTDDADW